jgi:plasmid stabilization system protein ParE
LKLVYSPEAVVDLRRLHDFVAEKNPLAARRLSKALRDGTKRLKQFPHMGRRVRQTPDTWAPEEIRDWVTGAYVARYLVLEETIVILRVWHQKENRPT